MRLHIPENVVFEVLEGQAVLLHLERGTYHSLNGSATRIWQLVEEFGDKERICETLAREFEVERDVIDQDVTTVVDDLLERGLIAVEG